MTDFKLMVEQENTEFRLQPDNTTYVYFSELLGDPDENVKLVEKFNEVIDLIESWVAFNYTTTDYVDNKLDGYVEKEEGKGLSTNDFTNQEKNKLASLENYDDTDIKQDIVNLNNSKQDKLVSGTNIKTINEQSILGSGNIQIESGASDWQDVENKPFESVGENLEVVGGVLKGIQPDVDGKIATHNTSSQAHQDIRNDIEDVREVAEGKTTTYVCSAIDNPVLNTDDDIITLTGDLVDVDGNTILLTDLKKGDNIYLSQITLFDRWYAGNNKLYKLETTKVDLTNYATKTYVDNHHDTSKQDKITSSNKLSYTLLKDTPTIPTKTSQITNDSDFITSSYHDATKQDKIDSTHKLSYSLLKDTPNIPVVPTNVSAFTNDSGYLTLATLPIYQGGVE